ncbi:MAG: SH3 domain-containing protein [Calditrichia bacterium]|nr:SH3 domain-containing protein [Calditrichia bacterium]
MKLDVIRYSSGDESTLGLFLINGKFACYTLEDEARTEKVTGETRIPAGEYSVVFRTEGRLHEKYKQKFPQMHKGMLHVTNVPDFQYILIHIGNTDDDTAGCLLVGETANTNIEDEGRITSSTNAYNKIYPVIAKALENDENVIITYHDNIPLISLIKTGFVNTSLLNMRQEPGLGTTKTGVLNKFTKVNIEDKIGDWLKISVEGWVSRKYVEKNE